MRRSLLVCSEAGPCFGRAAAEGAGERPNGGAAFASCARVRWARRRYGFVTACNTGPINGGLVRNFLCRVIACTAGAFALAAPSAFGCQAVATTAVVARSVDLRVLGVEVNQGFQDRVLTDSGPAPGHPGSAVQDSNPFFAGKPAVVRVYVGRAAALNDTTAVPATGQLIVYAQGDSLVLEPVASTACRLAPGSASVCTDTIEVWPSFGRQRLPARSDYDIDLLDVRADWSGSLNFVVPAEATATLTGPFTITARVEPPVSAGWRETEPGDNQFTVTIGNVQPQRTLQVRLIRVQMPLAPAPTRLLADSVLHAMLRMTPYGRIGIVSDSTFAYDGEYRTFRVKFLFFTISRRVLSQCQTLWLQLFQTYGVDPERPLLALTPSGAPLSSMDGSPCANLGAWLPATPLTENRSGGVALASMPTFGGDDRLDLERIVSVTHEWYHAAFDRRHVSNDHGEAGGCDVPSLIGTISRGRVDADCWKPAPYAHGVIGAWPEGDMDSGIAGDRGGMGIDIVRTSAGWSLTLYDPCPIGRLDRTSPVTTLVQRMNIARWEYACQLPDTRRAHDFMSYGPLRWTSRAQFFEAHHGTTGSPESGG
jgi:hypothetical protein